MTKTYEIPFSENILNNGIKLKINLSTKYYSHNSGNGVPKMPFLRAHILSLVVYQAKERLQLYFRSPSSRVLLP
ncbi:hypothetical protein VS868_08925 [Salinimicrobium sp. 3283s]|uniref:hypothetical protein n=1 Tax=Salinimicrobium sp. 3283s TaxID=3114359 RepID=UPI0031F033AA